MPRPLQDLAHDQDNAIRAMGALGMLLDSQDGVMTDLALAAIREGRPAYMSASTYHNASAARLAQDANEFGLDVSLREIADPRGVAGKHPLYLLGTLIPLNAGARFEIERLREIELAAHVAAALADRNVIPLRKRDSEAQSAVTRIMAAE